MSGMRNRAVGAALTFMAMGMAGLVTGSMTVPAAAEDVTATVQPRTLVVGYPADVSAISADGRYVAYSGRSGADGSGFIQVFRRDVNTGTTQQVSVGPGGRLSSPGATGLMAISASGRYVAFASNAYKPPPTIGLAHVLVRDLATARQYEVAVPGYGPSLDWGVTFSADERFLAFGDMERKYSGFNIYRWRIGDPHGYVLVSETSSGGHASWSNSSDGLGMSADGRFVAFCSGDPDLVPGLTVSGRHVYVRDVERGVTRLVDRTPSGLVSAGPSGPMTLSADGRHVIFSGVGDNIGQRNRLVRNVYRRDLLAGHSELLVASGSGRPRYVNGPRVSADGRYVAFLAQAVSERNALLDYPEQAYVADLSAHTVRRISVLPGGGFLGRKVDGEYPDGVTAVDLSADGRFASFTTTQPGLVPARGGDWPASGLGVAYRVGPLH